MEKQITVKTVASYNGHSIGANGVVTLNVVVEYSELSSSIQSLQMLNNDIKLMVKYPDSQVMNLGHLHLDNLNVGNDGESKLRFKAPVDFVEADNINEMALQGKGEKFRMKLIANIEVEEEAGE